MNPVLFAIPAAMIAVGIIFMIVMNSRGSRSVGVAENVMHDYILKQIPALGATHFDVINLLEDVVSPEYIWVVAFNKEGIYFVPSSSNPFTQTVERYEALSSANDYVPVSAITQTAVDTSKKRIIISMSDVEKRFKYQDKDMFGANQTEKITSFIGYLNSLN